MDHNIKIFSGTATKYLAEKIATSFGTTLGKSSVLYFSDGEFQPSFDETVRGNYVFIIQSTFMPSDNLMELLLMIDAAKRASAYKVIAVMPYFGFARQDRKDKPRVSIGAKMVANLLSASGVDRVITMDLHADQIQGFFDVPVDHLYASTIFLPYIKGLELDNLVIASPDTGGSKRANAYAKYLNTELVISHKFRKKANQVDKMKIIGDVKGKNVILLDDMIDTAGTITKAADIIMNEGAISVRAMSPSEKTVVELKLVYFNSASSKLLLDILLKLEEMVNAGNEVLVKWHYAEDDEDMQDAGEEYADIVDVDFEHISYELPLR